MEAAELVDLGVEALALRAESLDLGLEILVVAHRRPGEFREVVFELAAFALQRGDALFLTLDLAADGLELRAGVSEFLELVFEFGLFFPTLLDVAAAVVYLVFEVGQLLAIVFDLLTKGRAAAFQIGKLAFLGFDAGEFVVDVALFIF